VTSPAPTPTRPQDPAAASLYDALAVEHASIYGYGIVSAHSTPNANDLVSRALATHRKRREAVIAMLSDRSVSPPLSAAGYQLPMTVIDPDGAAALAVRMEQDCATAWRVVLEQAAAGRSGDADRSFAGTALTESAVLAARWRQVLRAWPVTQAFPGGSE
jgi:hypothetical protein